MTQLYIDPFGPPWKFQSLRMMLQWRGGILEFFWVQWISAMVLCTLYLVAWYAARHYQGDDLSATAKAFMDLWGYVGKRFQAAVSLMLGFYTTAIFNRWWQVRCIEGTAMNGINDLAVQISTLIRDEEAPDHSSNTAATNGNKHNGDDSSSVNVDKVRMNLIRWLNLAHALAVGELYEKQPNKFSSLQHLVDYGLLRDNQEYDYMKETKRSRYQAPFVWFLDLLGELKNGGKCGLDSETLVVFTKNVTSVRGSLAQLYTYKNVPVPLSYRQLVNMTVSMYMAILIVSGGFAYDVWDEDEAIKDSSIFFVLIPFFFEYFLFAGWLKLADALGNPFRMWADEFEWENYVRAVTLSSNLCLKSRKASTSLAELEKTTPSIEEKKAQLKTKWEGMKTGSDAHLKEDIQMIFSGDSEEGLVKARQNVTGY